MTDIDGGGIINCSIKSVVVGCVVGIPSTFFSGRMAMDSLPHLMDSIHSGLVLGSPDTPRLGPAEAGFSHSSSPIFPLCRVSRKSCIIMQESA